MNDSNVSASTQQQNSPITPEEFWLKLSIALRKHWNQQVDGFWFVETKKRTEFMTELLKKLAQDFNPEWHCVCEYWPRIDVSYFSCSAPDWAEWSWEAAIEVENDDNWKDEICKLMNINAGIKVLIAYVDKDNPKRLNDFFEKLPKIYRSRKYVTSPCNWLFVFGVFGVDWDFKAYKFDEQSQSVTPITTNVRIRPLS